MNSIAQSIAQKYIEDNEKPTLSEFLVTEKEKIAAVSNTANYKKLRFLWQTAFLSALKKSNPKFADDNSCLESKEEDWIKILQLINNTRASFQDENVATSTVTTESTTDTKSTTFSGLKRKQESFKIGDWKTGAYRSCDEWYIKDKNIIEDFKKFQDQSLEFVKTNKGTLLLKKDIVVLLSLSGVLLLEEGSSHSLLTSCFKTIGYSDIAKFSKEEFVNNTPSFPLELYVKYSTVVQKLIEKGFDYRDEFQEELMMMKKNEASPARKVLDALIHVAPEVVKPKKKKVSELDLCSLFVKPFIGRLLQEKNNDPHQSDELGEVDEKCRPDVKCVVYEDDCCVFTNAYGEVKPANIQDQHLIHFGLYKLALYGKEMLSRTKVKNVLCFQIHGGKGKAFMMKLACNNVCTMTEFCSFEIPLSLQDMDMTLNDLKNLTTFVQAYKIHCFEKEETDVNFLTLPSASLPLTTLFEVISTETGNKNRKNHE